MSRFDNLTPEQEGELRIHKQKLREQSFRYARVKDGKFVCDGVDLADTEWIAHVDSAVAGFIRFEANRPVETQTSSILGLPLRRPNTFTDRTKWVTGKYGPEDP